MTESDPHRLPRVARPRHYDLTLAPDLEAGTFTGLVAIDLDIDEPTPSLWCNSLELTITSATLEVDGSSIDLITVDEADAQRVRFDAGRSFAAGPARLKISFSGALIE